MENYSRSLSVHQTCHHVTCSYCQLIKFGWYWGGITGKEAATILFGEHDNAFLVRDSLDPRHILCVSFRCKGRIHHVRFEHANGLFSLDNETFVPPSQILEHCTTLHVKSVRFQVPVKLTRPLCRFARLNSLQKICRSVIRQTVPETARARLSLPPHLISYVTMGTDYNAPF